MSSSYYSEKELQQMFQDAKDGWKKQWDSELQKAIDSISWDDWEGDSAKLFPALMKKLGLDEGDVE